jgi:hypothetical protein
VIARRFTARGTSRYAPQFGVWVIGRVEKCLPQSESSANTSPCITVIQMGMKVRLGVIPLDAFLQRSEPVGNVGKGLHGGTAWEAGIACARYAKGAV